MSETNILIVEDNLYMAKSTKMLLQKLDYTVSIVASGEAAIKKAEEEKPDLVLMDIGLEGDMDGIQTAKEIYSRFHIPIIYLTAYGDRDTMANAGEAVHYGYIMKPFNPKLLSNLIRAALHSHRTGKKNSE